jgi:glycerol-3-phosphate responsive antiterminator
MNKLHHIIRQYIKRSMLIHRKGNPVYYNTAGRLASLDRLIILDSMLPGLSEKSTARLVVRYESDLINVLPFYTNKSFGKTREKLMELITRCKTEIICTNENEMV